MGHAKESRIYGRRRLHSGIGDRLQYRNFQHRQQHFAEAAPVSRPRPPGTCPRYSARWWPVCDRDQLVAEIQTMEEIVSRSIGDRRFSTLLLGVFAGLALLLSAIGIY